MAEFTVAGPFRMPSDQRAGGKKLHYAKFWKQSDEIGGLRKECGVYVFAVKAGKGYTPWYVGKATKSFGQECFSPTKRVKFYNALAEYKQATPVLFFVRHPKKPGKTNEKEIEQIESFLIQLAAEKNENLQNVQKKKGPDWSIAGVIRGKKGKPTKSAREFRKAIGQIKK